MADKHPYMSGGGAIVKAVQHFRRSLPPTIDASTLKRLGLAQKNESYLINILQFIKVIQEDGSPTDEARSTFTQHDDAAFAKAFGVMTKTAYADLFSLHGENAWTLDQSTLVTYFRQTDQTSAVVGTRQATTFQTLAELAGHRNGSGARSQGQGDEGVVRARRSAKQAKPEVKGGKPNTDQQKTRASEDRDFGLTVRIEINLPASDDQETYDRIFKSVRENLLNA